MSGLLSVLAQAASYFRSPERHKGALSASSSSSTTEAPARDLILTAATQSPTRQQLQSEGYLRGRFSYDAQGRKTFSRTSIALIIHEYQDKDTPHHRRIENVYTTGQKYNRDGTPKGRYSKWRCINSPRCLYEAFFKTLPPQHTVWVENPDSSNYVHHELCALWYTAFKQSNHATGKRALRSGPAVTRQVRVNE